MSRLAEFDQAGEVEGGFVQAAAYQLEAAGFRCFDDSVFLEGVGPGGFAGAGEQLTDALQQSQ